MEDQDREIRPEEEENDVEGHANLGAVNKGMHKARNDEGDDDVEAHVNLNAVNKGMHKA